ncbi:hypothetical protein Lesp02_29970 [Lentzea sp. NBRC 105346]|nr:hypothetical protein Lesp02_29970 [Lentzea sp. NBRC 105346]
MDTKLARLKSEARAGRYHYLEEAELIFWHSALLNRLAHISKKSVKPLGIDDTLVPWLARKTGWPKAVADAFWYCARNPVVHVGRAWVMADYGRTLDGAVLKAGFRPDILDETPATEMPEPNGTGWYMIDCRDIESEITIYFDFTGLRVAAEEVLAKVKDQVREMTPGELNKLRSVNERIPFLYTNPESEAQDSSPTEG